MTFTDLLADAFGRIRAGLHDAVDGLDPERLTHRPDAEANPVGWLAWHTVRIQDDHIADLMGVDQLYVVGGWAERLGLPADVSDIGYGHDAQEVARHCPTDADALLGYLDAVSERTSAWVAGIAETDLGRIVDERWDPPVTLGVRLVSILSDNLQHVGQAAYVRGLRERLGS